MSEIGELFIREIFEGDYDLVEQRQSVWGWGSVYQLTRVLDREIQEVYIECWNYYEHSPLEEQPINYLEDVHIQYGDVEPQHLYFSVYLDEYEQQYYIRDIQTEMDLKRGIFEEGTPCPIRIESLLRAIRLRFYHQHPLTPSDYTASSAIVW